MKTEEAPAATGAPQNHRRAAAAKQSLSSSTILPHQSGKKGHPSQSTGAPSFAHAAANDQRTPTWLARQVQRIAAHRDHERDIATAPTEVLTRTIDGQHVVQRRLR